LASAAVGYPTKPIRLLVPFAPGGGTDFFARTIQPRLSEDLGQPIIIDNRPGGATIIAAQALSTASADGYTLMLSSVTTYAINPGLYPKLPYDPVKGFAPISLTGRFPLALVVNGALPVQTLGAFVEHAKARPNTLSFGSPGNGSPHRLAMELFARRTGLQMTHVPYKGAAPALQDLISGNVQSMFLDVSTALPQLKSGRIRALAVASAQRLAILPEVATVNESGVSGFEASAWQGVVAPAGIPSALITLLNDALQRTLATQSVREQLLAAGIEPMHGTPAAFTNYQRAEITKWTDVIRTAKITPE
jgi:tripartite-type tricarboxylate transporter receptor subunit TctC